MGLVQVLVVTVLRALASSTWVVVRAISQEEFDDSDFTAAFSATSLMGCCATSLMYMIGPLFSI